MHHLFILLIQNIKFIYNHELVTLIKTLQVLPFNNQDKIINCSTKKTPNISA